MSYLDRLKGVNSEKRSPLLPQELQKAPFDSFCSTPSGHFQKISPNVCSGIADRWWLIHYPDREPVEVANFPDATHAEILERHPESIAAEPINRAAPAPTTACATCTHVTRLGVCGEPVAASLSDVVGVIRYHPDQGAACPAWLARLDADLKACILAMAEQWGYSGDDLALALAGARVDPLGWRRYVAMEGEAT